MSEKESVELIEPRANLDDETLADIAAEMRSGFMPVMPVYEYLSSLADRIEAAAKREKIEAVTLAASQAVNLTNEKWRRESGNTADTEADA